MKKLFFMVICSLVLVSLLAIAASANQFSYVAPGQDKEYESDFYSL